MLISWDGEMWLFDFSCSYFLVAMDGVTNRGVVPRRCFTTQQTQMACSIAQGGEARLK